MRKAPTPRSVAVVASLVVIFGIGGAIVFGALDEAQTGTRENLFDPAVLWGHVSHFFSQALLVVTTGSFHGTLYRTYLIRGLGTTIEFCFLAMPLALLLGLMLALMSRSKRRILRVPARGFVEFFRDTPLLVQLLAIYWALTFLGPSLVNAFTAGLATLALNYAAYECENLRAGIEALDHGQGEAAAVLGFSQGQSLRLIEIPQMIPIVLPPVINDLIYLFKDSAILSFVATYFLAAGELTTQTNVLSKHVESLSWQFYLWGGVIYLLLSLPLARAARVVEARLKSTAFVPRYDLITTALVVLGSMALVGWLCGVAVAGFTPANFGLAVQQLFLGLALTLGVLLFALIVFGVVLYLPRSLFRARRRRVLDVGDAAPLVSLPK